MKSKTDSDNLPCDRIVDVCVDLVLGMVLQAGKQSWMVLALSFAAHSLNG